MNNTNTPAAAPSAQQAAPCWRDLPEPQEITGELANAIMDMPCNWKGMRELHDSILMGHTMACEQGAVLAMKYLAAREGQECVGAQQAAGDSIRDFADFREDLERLSEPGLAKKQAKVIRKAIYDTIDMRVHNAEIAARAATPAQPIAPPNFAAVIEALRFYAEGQHFVLHDADVFDTVSGEPQNWQEDESNTIMFEDGSVAKQALAAHPIAQPIAVSAPTDEREVFDEAMREHGFGERHASYEHCWEMWQAARAAAPVSGQGASIGDDPEFKRLIGRYTSGWQDGIKPSFEMFEKLVAYIDSRPRSEDSRTEPSFIRKPEGPLAVEFTEWADTASGIKGWLERHNSQYDVRRMLCFLAWEEATRRALASTTPQKADDE